MFESLNLDKTKFRTRSITIVGILLFPMLVFVMCPILKPIYVTIGNPEFVYALLIGSILLFIALEVYNRNRMNEMIANFDEDAFVHHLDPLELVYLEYRKLTWVIHGTINNLVRKEGLAINADKKMALTPSAKPETIEERAAISVLDEFERTFYPGVLKRLMRKPVFTNISGSMDAFRKYVMWSKTFSRLFLLNLLFLMIPSLLAVVRFSTGISRDKPVTEIFVMCAGLLGYSIWYLVRLTRMPFTISIPNWYKDEVVTKEQVDLDWRWAYFCDGKCDFHHVFCAVGKIYRSGIFWHVKLKLRFGLRFFLWKFLWVVLREFLWGMWWRRGLGNWTIRQLDN